MILSLLANYGPILLLGVIGFAVIFLRKKSNTTPTTTDDHAAFFDVLPELEKLFSELGLPLFGELCAALRRGDWYVALKSARQILAALRNPEQSNLFDGLFQNLLSRELSDEDRRKKLARSLAVATRSARQKTR